MMNGIKERNVQIFKLRYEEGLKPKEIGRIFGISRQRVEQIAPRNREIEDAMCVLLLQECIKLGYGITQANKRAGISKKRIKKLIPKYNLQARIQRFWSQVQKGSPSECWPWLGYTGPNGYGVFNFRELIGKRNRNTHRIAWFLHNNQIVEDDMQILHTCDNSLCCNPNHLYMGTPLDNMRDRDSRGRGRSDRLFTEQAVIDMRKRHNEGESMASIRRNSYPNIGYSVVLSAIRGFTYKNVVEVIATSA